MTPLDRVAIARRVAQDIPEGAHVNLKIGLLTRVADFLPTDREIFLHSKNGVLAMGPSRAPGDEDPDFINAGKQPVTLLTCRYGSALICQTHAERRLDKGDVYQ